MFFSPLYIYIYMVLNFRGGAMYQYLGTFFSVPPEVHQLPDDYGEAYIGNISDPLPGGPKVQFFPRNSPKTKKNKSNKKVYPEPIFVNRVIVITPFFSRGPNDLGETRLFMGTHLTNTSNGTRASPASMAGGIRSTCVGSVEKVSDEKRAPGYWLCRGDILPITRVIAHFSLDDILAIGYIYLLGDCTT